MKKAFFENKAPIAYISALGGVEIFGIEYGINDHVYCISGAWSSAKSYHRVKINYSNSGNSYITLNGYRLNLNEAIRM